MANTIVCGRLDNRISFSQATATQSVRRIASDHPNTARKIVNFPIATDGKRILHADGNSDAASFLEMFSTNGEKHLIVLTIKEYFLLIEQTALRDVHLSILEVNYPIMANVKQGRSLRSNLDLLHKLLKKIDALDIKGGSFSQDQTVRHLHSVARKLRFKNTLDQQFFFAYKEGYQEVFKLKEERPDRLIIAFDFNSMYADCMSGQFCEPKSIRYECFANRNTDASKLDEGMYRVILRGANAGFFLDKHPFIYKRLGMPHRFKLAPNDSIETVLFKDELLYYGKFFRDVEIIEGFCSARTVPHPLFKKSSEMYARRRKCKSRGDSVMENFYKLSLQLMHSSTNQRVFRKKRFDSIDEALTFLSSEFHLDFNAVRTSDISRFLSKNKYIKIKNSACGVELRYLDIHADSLVLSLSARIVASARLKLMRTIERFLSDGSAEICYANVDSLHVSIAKTEVDSFLERHKDLISDQFGCLKIQAIADLGYWFDVGRYWLKKDKEVVLFKNIGFNTKWARSEFVTKRKMHVVRKAEAFSQVEIHFVNLTNSFSYVKRIKRSVDDLSLDYERYGFSEVNTPETADLTETMEIMNSKKLKVDLFRAISRNSDGAVDSV